MTMPPLALAMYSLSLRLDVVGDTMRPAHATMRLRSKGLRS